MILIISLLLPFVFSLSVLNGDSIEVSNNSDRVFSKFGRTWTQEIRNFESFANVYAEEKDKVNWSTSGSIVSVQELTGTESVYVGFCTIVGIGFNNSIQISINGKATAGNLAAQELTVGVFDLNWENATVERGSKSESLETIVLDFAHLSMNKSYIVFVYYADWWAANWDTKIELHDVEIISQTLNPDALVFTQEVRDFNGNDILQKNKENF